jgi:anti-sigma regulatory factor (Ser/Thr protein kinase)
MAGREADQPENKLSLQNNLSEIAKLPTWIRGLALRYAIPKETEFAVNVCLEEAVSNVIRHGYGEGEVGKVIVHFTMPEPDLFEFTVEDEAQHFNPLNTTVPNSKGTLRVGGQGIHFLRHFTQKLEYTMMPIGNRLSMVFSGADSGS